MIRTKLELQAIEETITRPVLVIVANDIKKLLGLTNDIYTIYDVRDNIIKKKNKLGNIRGDNTTKSDMMYIEATETGFENNELSLISIRPDFKPIYKDKEIGAKFQPVYLTKNMSIRVKYLSRSKSKIFAILNKLRLYTSNDRNYKRHQLVYHYTIPMKACMLLAEINNLKNKRSEIALTLEEYINSTFDDRVDLANSIDGERLKSDLVIRESQIDVDGYIQDDVHGIQPEYDEQTNEWSLEFEYSFIYEKPVTLYLNYPILVYNTMISEQFRKFIKTRKPSKDAYRTARSSDLYKLLNPFEDYRLRDGSYYLNIPEVDDFILPNPPSYYTRIFSALSLVNDANLTELFNIRDIPRIKFRDSVLKYILNNEYNTIGTIFGGLFYIELYKNEDKDTNKVIMDSDGTLRTEYPMDIKSTYRVVFNILTDLNFLNKKTLTSVKLYLMEEMENNELNPPPPTLIQTGLSPNHNLNQNITKIEEGSLTKIFLNLISVDDGYMYKELKSGTKPYEIPFKINDNKWQTIRTVQITHILASLFEKK